ncbi:hypothetical protein ACROYT_G001183 [Oculina patagonica]
MEYAGPGGLNKLGGAYINGKPLSKEIRHKIVALALQGVRPCDISRRLRITHGCISKLLSKYRKTGSIQPGGEGVGRPRVITPCIEQRILEYGKEQPRLFSWEIRDRLVQESLCSKESPPSVSSISRLLRNNDKLESASRIIQERSSNSYMIASILNLPCNGQSSSSIPSSVAPSSLDSNGRIDEHKPTELLQLALNNGNGVSSMVSSIYIMAVGHVATSSRYLTALLVLCIAFFIGNEIYFSRNVLETWKHRETTNVTSYQTKFGSQVESTQRQRPRCRGRRFLHCRVRHSTDERSWFNIQRLECSGDIHLNPGPTKLKFPCKECEKSVRNNQNAMLCSECGLWIHAKCLNMSASTFKYFLERPAIDWTCPLCSLPRLGDSFFLEDEEIITTEGNYANQLLLQPDANEANNTLIHSQENVAINNCGQQEFDLLLQEREEQSSQILMFHLNINSLQNKFEELKLLNDKMKSQIIFLSETKIDKSYSNSQFTLTGYNMYRKDRKKGGGGIIAYFDSTLPSKELKVTKKYKTIETLAIEARLGKNEVIFLGIYRPPTQSDHQPDPHYLERVEEELNDVCMWASLKKQIFILTGDLNLDRLKPKSREGRILADLEEVHGMQCLITKPNYQAYEDYADIRDTAGRYSNQQTQPFQD